MNTKPARVPAYKPAKGGGQTFYADTNRGSDSNSGTIAQPFKVWGSSVLVYA